MTDRRTHPSLLDYRSLSAAQLDAVLNTIADHALVEIRCDHSEGTDTAICNCGAWGEKRSSVQEAKLAWGRHLLVMLEGVA